MASQRLRRHGHAHGPGGPDPTPTGVWHNVGAAGEPPFVSGSNTAPTVDIPNPVPLRFRLSVGRANDMDEGTIVQYTPHQIEIQGDVSGVVPGDVVFELPAEFRHEYDVPYHTHADDGTYVPCRLFTTGEFVYGVV